MVDGGAYPEISEEALLYLGGVLGLARSLKAGGNGQPLAEAAEALREGPDFGAGADNPLQTS
jgi:hypothetical protein